MPVRRDLSARLRMLTRSLVRALRQLTDPGLEIDQPLIRVCFGDRRRNGLHLGASHLGQAST